MCQTGILGHVAIVERVNLDGTILISEGNAGGNGAFNTRTVYPWEYAAYTFIE
jgi:surface antigen